MTTYVDSSALLKMYVEEADSDVADQLLAADPVLVTSWVTLVEVRRNLARLAEPPELAGCAVDSSVISMSSRSSAWTRWCASQPPTSESS